VAGVLGRLAFASLDISRRSFCREKPEAAIVDGYGVEPDGRRYEVGIRVVIGFDFQMVLVPQVTENGQVGGVGADHGVRGFFIILLCGKNRGVGFPEFFPGAGARGSAEGSNSPSSPRSTPATQ